MVKARVPWSRVVFGTIGPTRRIKSTVVIRCGVVWRLDDVVWILFFPDGFPEEKLPHRTADRIG